MSDKVHIALCMGSSCFARGNNQVLATIEAVIKANGWQERVSLSGMRCGNLCSSGPNIQIDGKLYQGLDPGALVDLPAERLGVAPARETRARGAAARTSGEKGD